MKKYLLVTAMLGVSAPAQAEVIRMVCSPQDKPVTRIIEIDTVKQQARQWAVMSPTVTNGPFGPYNADINGDKIVWMSVSAGGKAISTTRYVIDRVNKLMTTDISYNWDQDPWHESAPCK